MMLADAPDRTTAVDLSVEAGEAAETTFEVTSVEPVGEVEIQLRGLPAAWYTLSAERLRLRAGERAHVLFVVHPPRLEHGGAPGVYHVSVGERVTASPSTWRLRVLPPGAEPGRGQRTPRSTLVEFLPRHYRTDEFLGRFLLIFQAALDPIERAIDNTHLLFDPGLTPAALLEWLASWLDLDLSSTLDVPTRRVLIERAVELYRWKGTRRGLRAELTLRLGAPALIVENFDGLRLGQDAALGVNTQLGRRCDGCVVVTLGAPPGADADLLGRAEALVDAARPASCGYVVRLAPATMATARRGEVVETWRV
jgi:phage tail-like protein